MKTTSGNYDHDVRVLLCDHCGANLPAGVGGGQITCGFCQAVNVVPARKDVQLAEVWGGQLGAADEGQRIAMLRSQDGKPMLPPAEVRRFLAAGALDVTRLDEAQKAFLEYRRRLLTTGDEKAEACLYSLILMLSGHFQAEGDSLRARAILEAGVEALREPRHRQQMFAAMARNAARAGELDAAEAWLAHCDARSIDLPADSAYRTSRAFISIVQGQPQLALEVLGTVRDGIPIDDMQDGFATILRAHAKEQVMGVPAAVGELLTALNKGDSFFTLEAIVLANRSPQLCPQSFPAFIPKVPFHKRSVACLPIGCTFIILVVLGPLLAMGVLAVTGQARFGLEEEGFVLFGLFGFFMLPAWYFVLRTRLAIARRRKRRAA